MIAFSNYQVLSQQEVFFPNSGRRRRSITWTAPLPNSYFKTWTYNEVCCEKIAINLAFDNNQIFILNLFFVNMARQYWSGHTFGLRALSVRCRLHIAFNAAYESLMLQVTEIRSSGRRIPTYDARENCSEYIHEQGVSTMTWMYWTLSHKVRRMFENVQDILQCLFSDCVLFLRVKHALQRTKPIKKRFSAVLDITISDRRKRILRLLEL